MGLFKRIIKNPIKEITRAVERPYREVGRFVRDPTGQTRAAETAAKDQAYYNELARIDEQKRLDDQRKKLQDFATDYEAKAPELRNQRVQGLLGTYGDTLREGSRKLKEDYNRRGLLYSGLRAKGEGEFKSGLEGSLRKEIYNVNKEISDISQAQKEAAAAVGLQNAQELAQRAEDLYNLQTENQLARQRSLQAMASGIGSLAGMAMGNYYMNNGAAEYEAAKKRGLLSGEDAGFSQAFSSTYLDNRKFLTPEDRGLNSSGPGFRWTGNAVYG